MKKKIIRVLAEVVNENVAGVIRIRDGAGQTVEWEILIEQDTGKECHGGWRLCGDGQERFPAFYIAREYFVRNIRSPRQVDHWRYAKAEVLFDKNGWVCDCLNQVARRMLSEADKRQALIIKLYDFQILADRARDIILKEENLINLRGTVNKIFETIVGMICIIKNQWEPMPDQIYEEVLSNIDAGDEICQNLLELLQAPSVPVLTEVEKDVQKLCEDSFVSVPAAEALRKEYFRPECREMIFRFSCL